MTVAAVLFALVGCGIAVYAILLGVEPGTSRFALAAYACLAGPLFLAAAISRATARTGHRTGRVTPPPGMEGRRVKRRLFWIAQVSGLLTMAIMLLTAAAVVFAMHQAGPLARGKPWGSVLFFTVPVAVAYLTQFALKVLYLRLGWMTQEEAEPFPFRMKGNRWPDSWLEPIEEPEPTDRPDTE